MSVETSLEINSMIFWVYADLNEADEYLTGVLNSSTWFAATEDTRKQALVTATRMFERQCWRGERTGFSGQNLQWPRTGTGIDGVVDDAIPQDIIDGSIELAFALFGGSSAQTNPTPGAQNIAEIKAGSVAITYFRDAEAQLLRNARFPLPVQELVGKYMCGASVSLGIEAFGTDGESVTAGDFGFSGG